MRSKYGKIKLEILGPKTEEEAKSFLAIHNYIMNNITFILYDDYGVVLFDPQRLMMIQDKVTMNYKDQEDFIDAIKLAWTMMKNIHLPYPEQLEFTNQKLIQ